MPDTERILTGITPFNCDCGHEIVIDIEDSCCVIREGEMLSYRFFTKRVYCAGCGKTFVLGGVATTFWDIVMNKILVKFIRSFNDWKPAEKIKRGHRGYRGYVDLFGKKGSGY